MMRRLCLVLGTVALTAVLATTAFAQNRGVDFIDPGDFGASGPFAFTVSYDGNTLGGSQGGGVANCIVWTEDTVWAMHALSDDACYMSKDTTGWGSALADGNGVEHMSRYNPDTGQQEVVNELPELAPCDFFQSSTFGISGDGKTLVGLGWAGCEARAISSYQDCPGNDCVPGGEMTRYESWVPGRANRMNGADQDASVLFGWQDVSWGGRFGAVWADGAAIGEHLCAEDDPFYQFCGEAQKSNSDGSAIVGGNITTPDTFGISEGWVLTEADGLRNTGQLPGAFFLDQGHNFAVSEDGRTTGGRFGFGPFSSATLWTEATGIINLNQFLIDQGRTEPFDGWFMVQVNDMSSGDQTRLAVWAASPGNFLGNQTVIIDITKVSVCHAPPGNPENARTLMIGWESVEDHVGHGDFLGTCEAAGGGFSRAQSATDFFGVDPTNACLQRSVRNWYRSNPAILQMSADEVAQAIADSENCNGRNIQRRGMSEEHRAPQADQPKRRVRRR